LRIETGAGRSATLDAGAPHGATSSKPTKNGLRKVRGRKESPTVPTAQPTPGKTLLTPVDHTLVLIDHQSQMAFATHSIDAVELRNNAALVARAAKVFGVDVLLSTVAEKTFSGPLFTEIKAVFPESVVLDRTTMNAWEDHRVTDRINAGGHARIVLAGLWTSVCIVGPALSALDQGFEVYVIADACGDVTSQAHDRAIDRMTQLGVRPMTSIQYLLELQRDWARQDTYEQTVATAIAHGGAYGLGLIYARTMFGAHGG
jgi:nicotinamidase-related amidase